MSWAIQLFNSFVCSLACGGAAGKKAAACLPCPACCVLGSTEAVDKGCLFLGEDGNSWGEQGDNTWKYFLYFLYGLLGSWESLGWAQEASKQVKAWIKGSFRKGLVEQWGDRVCEFLLLLSCLSHQRGVAPVLAYILIKPSTGDSKPFSFSLGCWV